jgi:hypothetical protein
MQGQQSQQDQQGWPMARDVESGMRPDDGIGTKKPNFDIKNGLGHGLASTVCRAELHRYRRCANLSWSDILFTTNGN